MGANTSTLQKLEPLIVRLGGSEPVDEDLFWRQLFLCSGALLASLNPKEVEDAVQMHIRNLLACNPSTRNFQRMLLHTVALLNDASCGINCRSAANAVHLIRLALKQVAQQQPLLPTLVALFEMPPAMAMPQGVQLQIPSGFLPLMRLLVGRVLVTIAELNVIESSQALLYECMQLLLVATSSLLYSSSPRAPIGMRPFVDILHSCAGIPAALGPAVVAKLLMVFIARPKTLTVGASTSYSSGQAGTDTDGIWFPESSQESSAYKMARSAAGAVFWVPSWTYSLVAPKVTQLDGPAMPPPSPLADLALLLLLLLLYSPDDPPSSVNAFKASIPRLHNTSYTLDIEARISSANGGSTPAAAVHFGQLYDALCVSLVDEPVTLLLYTLLHGCRHFKDFVFSRTDIETLVQPVLRLLYNCSKDSPSHMYMLQILVLILSQDASFSQNVHKVPLPSAGWYQERLVGPISLGSLTALVLLRTVSSNFNATARDLLLPTNALAALANMAPHIAGLHSLAAQKLVMLLQALSRLYLKEQKSQQAASLACSLDAPPDAPELVLVEEFLRIVLEILNAVMTGALQRNTELLYALLHKQELLAPLKDHPRLADLVNNLQIVVDWFNQRLDDARSKEPLSDWTVEGVQKTVASSAQFWRGADSFRAFPELRFVYEEEGHSEDFFIPYVWSIIVPRTTIPWDRSAIKLFAPPSAPLEREKSPCTSKGGSWP